MRDRTQLVNRKFWHRSFSRVEEEFQYAGNSRHCSNIHRCYWLLHGKYIHPVTETPGKIKWAGPKIGAQNDEIYKDLLKLTDEQLHELKQKKVI